MSEQRTEKASPQRKKKARDSGDIVRSRELLSGVGMLAGLIALGSVGGRFVEGWRQCYLLCIRAAVGPGAEWGLRDLSILLKTALLPATMPVFLIMSASLLAVLAIGFAQSGGLVFNSGALAPKLDRINPGSQIKNLVSIKSLVRLAKSLLPAFVVGAMGWSMVDHMTRAMPVMSLVRLPETFAGVYSLGMKSAWVMVAWAGIDYAVEWRSWNQRLKMSKQEVREEIKEAMGNPQIKGKIRAMQRTMARRKTKVDMRRASVVITNPTHYAVALEFDFDTMSAPTVLTKGRDLQAFDIREEARWAGVPIIENPPLARSLYRAVEPGQGIPYELYAAVAGILAYLFREQQEQKARDEQRSKQARADANVAAPMAAFQGGM